MTILVVLFCSLIQAKLLHDGWHYSGDTFTVDDDVYLVTHFDFYDYSVVLQVNEDSYVITEGTCKTLSTMQYCIEEIFRDIENADEDDYIKFEAGVAYAGINVIIYTRGPDIDVSRSFSTTTPELNGEVSVTVTVKNDGTEGTDSFYFKDSLPEEVLITGSSSGTTRSSRTVRYEVYLSPGIEKTFTYKFKVTDYVEFTTKPESAFTYEGVKTNVSVSSKTIKVNKPYTLTATLSPGTVEATDQSAISIKVENDVSEDITVDDLRITIPSYISLTTKPGELEKKNEKYYWSGIIGTDDYKMINLLIKPVKSGTYEFPVSIEVTDSEEKQFSETKTLKLTSKIEELNPILSVIDTSISEGANFRVAFSVENPNDRISFKNIEASIISDIFPEMKVELEELMPGHTKTLLVNDTLTAPFLDDKTNYVIEAKGIYETSTNEKFNFSEKETLTVTPVAEVITLIQDASKKTVEAGSNVTITIKIRNNNEEAITVDVNDEYSPEAELIGGKTRDTIIFNDAGTEEAYDYNLRIPLDYDKEELIITTTASIKNKDYVDNKTTTLTITFPEPVEEEEEVVEEVVEEEPEPEKKPGFFEKIIDSVFGFFSRLLGFD